MNLKDILHIKITDQGEIDVLFGPIAIIILIIAVIALIVFIGRRLLRKGTWDPVEVDIVLGNIGKMTIRPNHEIVRIAHQAWTDLITRKAGIMYDDEHDVIAEIYNSWYELFKEFRNLTKSIPAEKIREYEDARRLVDIMIKALNVGLRPHLTQWQAKFRRWYSSELEKHPEKSPQEVQRLYPDYGSLVKDLRNVNQQMVEFAEALRKIGHGKL